MKKYIIIGGSGFVGSNLLKELKAENCANIDKKDSLEYNEITVKCDIRDTYCLDKVIHPAVAVVLLAAEHRDDVSPISLYYDVNVQGTKNVLHAMDHKGIKNILFTSSVAVYGLNKDNPSETHPADPFNHYGKSKWQAEEVLRNWYDQNPEKRSLTIIRPTVIFGERNRGNVFNLLKQIASGRFLMIGKGQNKKSMAYVGNVAAFIKHCIQTQKPGYRVFNYVDKPDFNMNELVAQVEVSLNKKLPSVRIPYSIGKAGSLFFDLLAKVTNKPLAISLVRVKKFCATTQFDATSAHSSDFIAPFTLAEGLNRTLHYEFLDKNKDQITFESE